MALKAWCNSYEVVAAETPEQATEVLKATGIYSPEEYEDYGLADETWESLDEAEVMREEDGTPTSETVGSVLHEKPEPRHLWSIEQ